MEKLSDIFRGIAQDSSTKTAIIPSDPHASLANLAAHQLKPGSQPVMINVLGLLASWWAIPKRPIYRITQESAEYLRRVNLSFIPEQSPESWGGDAIVLESTSQKPIIDNYFSVGAYRMQAITSKEYRYYFVCLNIDGSASSFSVSSDTGKVNNRMAKDGALLDVEIMRGSGLLSEYTGAEQISALFVMRFVFAASYYIQNAGELPHVSVVRTPGPSRSVNGKTLKGAAPLWQYGDLRIDRPIQKAHTGVRGELDRINLSLEPTLVSPHIRRRGGRVMIIDAYDSHRWKKEYIGKKIKI
jgi:hypothetical protein